jgi:hypothetical protein
MNGHDGNFRQFSPFERLNSSVLKLSVLRPEKSKSLELEHRAKRYGACVTSFHRNTIRLHRLLDSIAGHFNVSYDSQERKAPYHFRLVKSNFGLGNDLLLFFTILKILLDDIAFFVPFYFRDPLKSGRKNEDLRDLDRPFDFQALKHYFYKRENIDGEFVEILRRNEEWINDLCDKRKFLIHRFHDLSVDNDCWTHAYCAFLYEFNNLRAFVPNVLTYVSRMYYHFVAFTEESERHFRKTCRGQFTEFEYSEAGQAYSGGLDRTHLFFAGLGRLLENKILIRIHPARRSRIPIIMEYFMREEKVVCSVCSAFRILIRPIIEDYVVISSSCNCGKPLPIPLRVEEKVFSAFHGSKSKTHTQPIDPV